MPDYESADEYETREAYSLGRKAGEAGASWVFDGNTSLDTYRTVLRGLVAGDPKVMDKIKEPNLSGEYADDLTEWSLASELGVTDTDLDQHYDRVEAIADAWEAGVSDTFWPAIEREAREHVREALAQEVDDAASAIRAATGNPRDTLLSVAEALDELDLA